MHSQIHEDTTCETQSIWVETEDIKPNMIGSVEWEIQVRQKHEVQEVPTEETWQLRQTDTKLQLYNQWITLDNHCFCKYYSLFAI